MKTLHLVLNRKWYNMIDCGFKTEEYREIKPYWSTGRLNHIGVTDSVVKLTESAICIQTAFEWQKVWVYVINTLTFNSIEAILIQQ